MASKELEDFIMGKNPNYSNKLKSIESYSKNFDGSNAALSTAVNGNSEPARAIKKESTPQPQTFEQPTNNTQTYQPPDVSENNNFVPDSGNNSQPKQQTSTPQPSFVPDSNEQSNPFPPIGGGSTNEYQTVKNSDDDIKALLTGNKEKIYESNQNNNYDYSTYQEYLPQNQQKQSANVAQGYDTEMLKSYIKDAVREEIKDQMLTYFSKNHIKQNLKELLYEMKNGSKK